MSESTDVTKLSKLVKALLQEVSDLRLGIPFHVHRCSHGETWRCVSPYCERIESDCIPHGGGPIGRPPEYAIDARYAREVTDV